MWRTKPSIVIYQAKNRVKSNYKLLSCSESQMKTQVIGSVCYSLGNAWISMIRAGALTDPFSLSKQLTGGVTLPPAACGL